MPRILIADDDRDIRDLVGLKLVQAGHRVDTVEDGASAWAALQRNDHDLAILDIMMPGMTGLEVLRAARRNPSTAGVPVLLLTARSREVDIEEGYAAGADDYVLKPFSPRELVTRVRELFEARGVCT